MSSASSDAGSRHTIAFIRVVIAHTVATIIVSDTARRTVLSIGLLDPKCLAKRLESSEISRLNFMETRVLLQASLGILEVTTNCVEMLLIFAGPRCVPRERKRVVSL